ncbi:glycosyl hydrolase family 3 [Psychrosphaera sp. B3R10]|nr:MULTISPECIES: glycoside hydrolase family 3 N-terminal domain-containing protein [unclassified Psychrosphaera]MBU2883905.1 glycosyl hydrolase family 3 [Psychrosphaera sp. I2R16]MBU2988768.1 glycosyl hydrolase family 3 [Psychrosphaera sp. B3R10]MDO6718544.1 glycoside hydrolase family 3 N-terminal domain-containing protein [Psychrosphaera sp. 1_MG-2023]
MATTELDVKNLIGQKIMLDLRYYCDDEGQPEKCRKPLTTLTPELAKMISDYNLGGVILFSENLQTLPQIVSLNHQLQQATKSSPSQLPLFISIDQEGGRVARLPRSISTAFNGNMAIGATYAKFNDKFAKITGDIIGKELAATGFNVNHAPTVDVNVNADNPVINVRSFGEQPELVAKLAYAQLTAMQKHNVIATLKHFPGHGDTNVDSHTGLPVVGHSLEQIKNIDLAPFQYAIDKNAVSMIMTAHIQFPALDSSTFISKSGNTMMKPATMSKAILTDLLRKKMGFDGVVITDALDMKGISDFFTESEAVIETFKAGADIALMPIKIRNRDEISKLNDLLDKLSNAVETGVLDKQEISNSYARIARLKSKMLTTSRNESAKTLSAKINAAEKVVGRQQHRDNEQVLSDASITLLQGSGELPKSIKTLQIFMPDDDKCAAMLSAFRKLSHTIKVDCSPYYELNQQQIESKIMLADAIVATSVTPQQSLAEMGGMDDYLRLKKLLGNLTKNKRIQDEKLQRLLSFAQSNKKHISFVSLRMPYETSNYRQYADSVITTYSYNQYADAVTGEITGPAYLSLAKLLLGQLEATGVSPVTIK